MTDVRKRLADVMNQRRRQLRMQWIDVAERAGMGVQNLLRIRTGQIGISEKAADGIDDALGWEPGSVEKILNGGKPTPLGGNTAEGKPSGAGADESDLSALFAEIEHLNEEIQTRARRIDEKLSRLQEAFRCKRRAS